MKNAFAVAALLLLSPFVFAQDAAQVDAQRRAARDAAATSGGVKAQACPATPITPPVTINGQLKVTSCKDILGLYEDVYSIVAFAGQTIEINYSSSSYETFLYMYLGNGTSAHSDTVSFLSSGTSRRRIRHTFASSGTYYIEAEALFSPSSGFPNTGPYTLSVAFDGGCVPSTTTACLLNGRYSARVRYRSAFDNNAVDATASVKNVSSFGTATSQTVFFYFNNENNIELMLKMLDQGNTNNQGQQTMAVLYGTATPLRIELTITDTKTSAVKTYVSDFGKMGGGTDFTAFIK